jgi:type II secretory pathway predicted ATPase ExeA
VTAFIGVGAMYETYFGLRESPFNVTPNPRYFFPNSVYRDALFTLRDAILQRAGVILITGEAGTGKTTLLKKFLSSRRPTIQASCVLDPHLNFNDILQCTLDVFGLAEPRSDTRTYIRRLHAYLLEQRKNGRFLALFLDEAQALDDRVLEELVALAALESGGKGLLQIVLLGQPELELRLAEPRHRTLKARVTRHYRVVALSRSDVSAYIDYRLLAAGYGGKTIFLSDAIDRVSSYSRGIPRLVNILCDNALLVSCTKSRRIVDAETIREVAAELRLERGQPSELEEIPAPAPVFEISGPAWDFPPAHEDQQLRAGARPAHWQQFAARLTERFRVWKRVELGWAAAAAGSIAFVAIVARGTLLSPLPEPQMYLSPLSQNVEKIKDFLAPVPEVVYRAVMVRGEPIQTLPPPEPQEAIPRPARKEKTGATIESEPTPEDGQQAKSTDAVQKVAPKDPREVKKPAEPASDSKERREIKKAAEPASEFRVIKDSIVRDKPSPTAEIVATLHPGMEIKVVRRTGDYLQIRSAEKDGVRGYVHEEDAFFKALSTRVIRQY